MMMMMMMMMIIIIIIIIIIEADSKCKPCKQLPETVEHITSSGPILAKEQYTNGHDRVCAELHCNIC